MDYTVIDLEMTGLSVRSDRMIELGAVKVQNGIVVDTYGTLVNPGRPIPPEVTALTGITEEMAAGGLPEGEAVAGLFALAGDDVLVGHNVKFDYSFLRQWAIDHKMKWERSTLDTLKLARALLPAEQSKRLESLCAYFEIPRARAHRALDDAMETYQIFERLIPLAFKKAPQLLIPQVPQVRVKRRTPATVHQVKWLKEFRQRHHITDAICWETLTRGEASRLQDCYYRDYGRD